MPMMYRLSISACYTPSLGPTQRGSGAFVRFPLPIELRTHANPLTPRNIPLRFSPDAGPARCAKAFAEWQRIRSSKHRSASHELVCSHRHPLGHPAEGREL